MLKRTIHAAGSTRTHRQSSNDFSFLAGTIP
eukprot:SAG31_NODE_38472_length_296_cov_0.527919_1_plen_30_part_10